MQNLLQERTYQTPNLDKENKWQEFPESEFKKIVNEITKEVVYLRVSILHFPCKEWDIRRRILTKIVPLFMKNQIRENELSLRQSSFWLDIREDFLTTSNTKKIH